jgi:hypothetical protein
LSRIADKSLGKVLRLFAELELSKGEIIIMKDGSTKYLFNLEEEKAKILKEAIIKVAFLQNFSDS